MALATFQKLFKKVVQNKLQGILLNVNTRSSNLRNAWKFRPVITSNALKLCSRSIVLEVSIAFYSIDFLFFIF